MEKFALRFHCLEGITIAEKKRSFNLLINQLKQELKSEKDLNSFISVLEPRNKFEELLRVEILIRFQKNDALLDVLKSGRALLIRKVLKSWKFFEDAFEKVDELELVNEIFPYTSYSSRTKIIANLSKNLKSKELADAYFKAIESKYGLPAASALLPACSLDLIKTTIEAHKVNLTNRQLVQISKKHREFFSFYLDVVLVDGLELGAKYQYMMEYIAKNDTDAVLTLDVGFLTDIHFGHSATIRLLQANKDVLKDERILSCLNWKATFDFVKRMDDDVEVFFLNNYPRDINQFLHIFSESSNLRRFLRLVPQSDQYQLLCNCFQKKYGRNMPDYLREIKCLNYIPEVIWKIMPEKDREAYLDNRILESEDLNLDNCILESGDLTWMYKPEKAIQIIKYRIEHTPGKYKRADLLCQLMETCQFNADPVALLDVLKYMQTRHKYDVRVMENVFCNYRFFKCWRQMKNLNSDHWNCMKDLVKFSTFSSPTKEIFEAYFMHQIKNNLPYDRVLEHYLKQWKEDDTDICLFKNHSKLRKLCLEEFGQIILGMFENSKYENLVTLFLKEVIRFNLDNPNNKIAMNNFSEIIDLIKVKLVKNNFNDCDIEKIIMRHLVKFPYENNVAYDLFFWENYKMMHTPDLLIWYTKTNPNKIMDNMDKILTSTFTIKRDSFLRTLSLTIACCNMTERLVKVCLSALDNEETVTYAVRILSHVLPESQYFDIIEDLIRSKRDRHVKNFLKQIILQTMTNLDNPLLGLPITLNLLTADPHIPYGFSSLCRIACNSMELKLCDLFNPRYEPVGSIRQHVVSIITVIAPKEVIYKFLSSEEYGNNCFLRKFIVCFARHPSDTFWNLLERKIRMINNKQDRKTYKIFMKVLHKISPKYMPKYIPLVYEILSQNSNEKISRKKYKLLKELSTNELNSLDIDFLKKTTTEAFSDKSTTQNFCAQCFFGTSSDKRAEILDTVLKVSQKYWTTNVSQICYNEVFANIRGNLYGFVFDFCLRTLEEDEDLPKKFFATPEEQMFPQEYLLLQFTNAYVNCATENKFAEFGIKASEILAVLVECYDASVIHVFVQNMLFFLQYLDKENIEDKLFTFVESLAKSKHTQYVYIAILNMLSKHDTRLGDMKKRFGPIISEIRRCEVPVVQLHFKRYLRRMAKKNH